MRLAVLTSSISRKAGGLFFSVRSLNSSLTRYIQVRVFAAEDEYTVADIAAWDGVDVSLGKQYLSNTIGFQPNLVSRVLHFKPDVIHLNGVWMYPTYAAYITSKLLRVPLIISPRGMLDEWALKNSRAKKYIAWIAYVKRTMHYAKCLHALNHSEALSIDKLGLKKPIAIIGNGVEINQNIVASKDSVADSVSELLVTLKNCNHTLILFMGRLHPKKGLSELIDAWNLLNTRRTSSSGLTLVIAGPGDARYIDAMKSRIRFKENLIFTGAVYGATKQALLRAADLFVLPSYSEGQPIALLEAMSFGIPTLITEACNMPESIRLGAAIKIEPDADSILAGINQFLKSSIEQKARMSELAKTLIKNKHDWAPIACEMNELYRWMLIGCGQPNFLRVVHGSI
jgi:glycosyltransferase involved in cell wall biosynthesis